MKSVIFILIVLVGSIGQANNKCMRQAKSQAKKYSARLHNVKPSDLGVANNFFIGEVDDVLFYGVLLTPTLDDLNVGLKKSDCSLKEINLVFEDE
jgi:hypothetical protein